jgi:hypothetical protein
LSKEPISDSNNESINDSITAHRSGPTKERAEMSDFSVPPLEVLLASLGRGYSGLHVEQGVPLLDRDLNLMQDLLAAGVQALFSRYVGDGIAAGTDGFAIGVLAGPQPPADFAIAAGPAGPGTYLAGGIEASIQAPTSYHAQPGLPALSTPGQGDPDPRVDLVYLDVFVVEVDGQVDPDLLNSLDVGSQTSVRLRPTWQVRVSEGAPLPSAPAGHVHSLLAEIRRPRGKAVIDDPGMITDRRRQRLTVADLERRLDLVERLLLIPAFVPFNPQAPNQLSPARGGIGTPVTLNGRNFDVAPLTIRFGDLTAVQQSPPSSSVAVARVPAGLTPDGVEARVKVTVGNEGGFSTSQQDFIVQPNPVFVDQGAQFDPTTGLPGSRVTLSGVNFNVPALRVAFGGIPATVLGTPSATQATVAVPDGLAPAGQIQRVNISVGAPGLGTDSSDLQFTAIGPVPAPALGPPGGQFAPVQGGGGTAVTIKGTNLERQPVTVAFDTTVVTPPPAQVTPTQITVALPAGLTPRKVFITVTTAGGSVVSTDQFTITG